tara:strand:+ start:2626 stop:3330 length:705 start_codon:yes stop_codon:yes gene_type:complete
VNKLCGGVSRFQATPVIFLACKVFEGIVDSSNQVTVCFIDYGLHSVPRLLKKTLQQRIDNIQKPSMVVLGYGLCGNGLNEIQAGKHTLLVPKADDCVALFMGSRQRYLDQFSKTPGTYYLTKGWLEVGSDPLSEYEKLFSKYGQETADWLMEQQYQNYKRLTFVAHSQDDFITNRPRIMKVADYCQRFGMEYDEYLGCKDFLDQISGILTSQQAVPPDFIVVPPGGVLKQEMFL